MDNNKYNNEQQLIEITNRNEKDNVSETYSNKMNDNDNNTTKEDDSIYTIEEVISYYSSPKTGLVSINKTKQNKGFFLSIGPEINNITNTITLKVAMIKKEISFSESSNEKEISRVHTHHKKEKKDNNDNSIYIHNKTYSSKEPTNDRDKKDKIKSFFKKKTKRIKDHQNNEEKNFGHNNQKNKISKGKKKKTRKN